MLASRACLSPKSISRFSPTNYTSCLLSAAAWGWKSRGEGLMPKASVHPVMFRGMMTLKNYTQCCKLDIKTTPAPSLHIIHLQTELTDTKFFQTLRLIPKMSKKQMCPYPLLPNKQFANDADHHTIMFLINDLMFCHKQKLMMHSVCWQTSIKLQLSLESCQLNFTSRKAKCSVFSSLELPHQHPHPQFVLI